MIRRDILEKRIYSKNKIAYWNAWVICPVITLFSYMPLLNQVARGIFSLFIFWFFYSIYINNKKRYSALPIMLYMIWGAYSLYISVYGLDFNLSFNKWLTVFLLGLVSIAVSNAVVWCGSFRPWAWAYLVSIVLSIISNHLPIQSYLLIDYQSDTYGRTVGTFGNANTYGRAMVHGSILAVLLMFYETSNTRKLLILIFLGVFGIAVLQSGSRTAFVGYALVLLGVLYSVGWSVIKIKNMLLIGSFLGSCLIIMMTMSEKVAPIFGRMNILLSYIGLVDRVYTKEKSLDHRYDLMDSAWNTWLNNPLGVGLDNYRVISGVYAHSNYFELLASVGLIGLVLYYCCYFSFYRFVKRTRGFIKSKSQQKILFVFIVIMLVMDISNISYYSKHLWLLIGILCGYVRLIDMQYKKNKTA